MSTAVAVLRPGIHSAATVMALDTLELPAIPVNDIFILFYITFFFFLPGSHIEIKIKIYNRDMAMVTVIQHHNLHHMDWTRINKPAA